MADRLLNLLSLRGRALTGLPSRSARVECIACGEAIVADHHAIQLAGGLFHAGCVLYRPRSGAA